MYTVYALYSPGSNKIYIGYSSDIVNRVDSHNFFQESGYTKRYRPWDVVHTEEFATKKEAMIREKQLKSAKGREFIWNIVKNKYNLG